MRPPLSFSGHSASLTIELLMAYEISVGFPQGKESVLGGAGGVDYCG